MEVQRLPARLAGTWLIPVSNDGRAAFCKEGTRARLNADAQFAPVFEAQFVAITATHHTDSLPRNRSNVSAFNSQRLVICSPSR